MKVTNEQAVGRDVARNVRQVASELEVITTDAAALDTRVIALEDDSGWQTPTLAGSWANYGSGKQNAQYRKQGDKVTVRGLVKSGSGTIFTLPTGYRPASELDFVTTATGAFGQLNITTAGVVSLAVGVNTYVAINLTFHTS
jgi:hypothetical protein